MDSKTQADLRAHSATFPYEAPPTGHELMFTVLHPQVPPTKHTWLSTDDTGTSNSK